MCTKTDLGMSHWLYSQDIAQSVQICIDKKYFIYFSHTFQLLVVYLLLWFSKKYTRGKIKFSINLYGLNVPKKRKKVDVINKL